MSSSNMSYNCKKCGRLCKDRRGLSKHENVCILDRGLTCKHCGVSYSVFFKLKCHLVSCKAYHRHLEEEKINQLKIKLEHKIIPLKYEYEQKLEDLQDSYSKEQNQLEESYIKTLSYYDKELDVKEQEYYQELSRLKTLLQHKDQELQQKSTELHMLYARMPEIAIKQSESTNIG